MYLLGEIKQKKKETKILHNVKLTSKRKRGITGGKHYPKLHNK